jgi:hypothetical protein
MTKNPCGIAYSHLTKTKNVLKTQGSHKYIILADNMGWSGWAGP